jgi:hypothetical protein
MSGFGDPVAGGGGALVRPSIHSPGYVAGSQGWSINKDGSVEFNNGTFRGTVSGGSFVGTNWIEDSEGLRCYSGTPTLGNLVVSIAPAAGTDTYGNAFPAGIASFVPGTPTQISNILNGVVYSGYASDVSHQIDYAHALQLSAESATTALLGAISTATQYAVQMLFTAGKTSGGPDAASPTLQLQASSNIYVPVIGAVVGGDNINGVAQWIDPTTASSWATGWAGSTTFNGQSGLQTLRSRMTNEDAGRIVGCAAAVTGASNSVFTVPSQLIPARSQGVPALQWDPTSAKVISGFARIASGTGLVTLPTANGFANSVNGTQVWVSGSYPLGHIP